jgi:two-component system LytT family sensor kinase
MITLRSGTRFDTDPPGRYIRCGISQKSPNDVQSTFLTGDQFLLTTLVVKIAVVALLTTMLVRYSRFRGILLTERRAWPDKLVFAGSLGIPMTCGVVARLLLHYNAADLTLEGTFLAGLIAGPYAAAIVGCMVAVPSLAAGEWLTLPFAVGVAFAAGGLREVCPKEEIWRFSPFVFISLPKRAWHLVRTFKTDWQVILLLAPIALELVRLALGHRFGIGRVFYLDSATWWVPPAVLFAAVLGVGTPIKIWNNARIEHRLEEQERRLMKARIDALAGQINPHFLFNTLASISSLIRTQPETARTLIVKLSSLLRRRLKSSDHFTTLGDELASIDEYLDIETVRFGSQLQIVKQIDPSTLDTIVPSMILQPLVENSIKHGISPKVGGGSVTIRSWRKAGRTLIEVEDNGLGMPAEVLENALSGGIGLSNVNERLKVIYGSNCRLSLRSTVGAGTCATMEIPEVATAMAAGIGPETGATA